MYNTKHIYIYIYIYNIYIYIYIYIYTYSILYCILSSVLLLRLEVRARSPGCRGRQVAHLHRTGRKRLAHLEMGSTRAPFFWQERRGSMQPCACGQITASSMRPTRQSGSDHKAGQRRLWGPTMAQDFGRGHSTYPLFIPTHRFNAFPDTVWQADRLIVLCKGVAWTARHASAALLVLAPPSRFACFPSARKSRTSSVLTRQRPSGPVVVKPRFFTTLHILVSMLATRVCNRGNLGE